MMIAMAAVVKAFTEIPARSIFKVEGLPLLLLITIKKIEKITVQEVVTAIISM